MAAQTEYDEPRPSAPAQRGALTSLLPNGETSIVPADSISGRALARRHRDHDISRRADARRRGAGALGRGRMAVGGRARGHDPDAAVDGRDIEADVRRAAGARICHSGRGGRARLHQGRIREPAGAVARQGARARPSCRYRAWWWCASRRGNCPTSRRCAKQLGEQIPGATLDDHRGWIERMRAMSRSAVGIGLAILVLVVAATMLSVMFATRAARCRPTGTIIEVLHVVGAGKPSLLASSSAISCCSA